MRVIPRNKGPRLTFFRSHAARWVEQADAIGLPAEAAAAFKAMVDELEAAVQAQNIARQEAIGATRRVKDAMAKVERKASAMMKTIHAHNNEEQPKTLSLAWLPKKKRWSRQAPPGRPTNFKFRWQQVGWLTLRWTCKNPPGSQATVYAIHRRTDVDPVFRYVGHVGKRKFTDTTIPRGVGSVEYQIQARRGRTTGPVARYQLHLHSVIRMPIPGGTPNTPHVQSHLAA